jgi:hypothetical protein
MARAYFIDFGPSISLGVFDEIVITKEVFAHDGILSSSLLGSSDDGVGQLDIEEGIGLGDGRFADSGRLRGNMDILLHLIARN